jgi:hypothetical protein
MSWDTILKQEYVVRLGEGMCDVVGQAKATSKFERGEWSDKDVTVMHEFDSKRVLEQIYIWLRLKWRAQPVQGQYLRSYSNGGIGAHAVEKVFRLSGSGGFVAIPGLRFANPES